MDGKIVYKSTSEFLRYINDKAKGKVNKPFTKINKNNKSKNKDNSVNIQTGKLNFQ